MKQVAFRGCATEEFEVDMFLSKGWREGEKA
jgi:hypothetical protein